MRSRGAWGVSLLLVAASAVLAAPPTSAVDQPLGDATPVVETDPVLNSGDAADDPAIWRDPQDPARSVVIGNDKLGALEVYDLTGNRLQRLADGRYGNVDTRVGFVTGTGVVDLVVAQRGGVRVHAIDPVTRTLTNITDHATGSIPSTIGGEGLCLYRSPQDGTTYAFLNNRSGVVLQYALTDQDADGLVEGTPVRQWDVGGEVEGCVADDTYGRLYISEEDVGIWRYGPEPGDPTSPADRVLVDATTSQGGHIRPDAEGLTIVEQPGDSGYLIASSQAASDTANSYLVYERQGSNAFIRELQVVGGPLADGCGRTDGIAALAGDLGPAFPQGLFVCQDNSNTAPAPGLQNFKLVPLEQVVGLTTEPPGPRPPVAVVDHQCSGLTCQLSAARSTDPDGAVTAYSWDLGDSTSSDQVSLEHTFAASGAYEVRLTVTDDSGMVGETTVALSVSDQVAPIEFVAATMSNGNRRAHRVTVPAAVTPGDTLVLLMGTNTNATIGQPTGVAGWSQLGLVPMSGSRSTVWTKTAGASDPGTALTVTTSTLTKSHLVLLAYRGTDPADPVAGFSGVAEPAGLATHLTPVIAVPVGAVVLSYWTHKDGSAALLQPPPGVVVRASGTQSGSGNVKGLVADSGAPVVVTSYGGYAATASSTSKAASVWTVALAPLSVVAGEGASAAPTS